jgi:hypothetical protein
MASSGFAAVERVTGLAEEMLSRAQELPEENQLASQFCLRH